MADFSGVINESIIRKIRRKLYGIICEHVKNCDDENAMEHIKRFLEGVSWATGLQCEVRGNGEVYVYLKSASGEGFSLLCIEYKVVDIYIDTRILRNSINRHYHKAASPVERRCAYE